MAEATFQTSTWVRPHIQAMPAYTPILPYEVLAERLGRPAGELVKLDANENPYGPLPEVLEALSALPYAHIYPDPESRQLRAALAEWHDLPVDNLLAGAGADELIDLLLRTLVDPGQAVIDLPPTFGMYAFDGALNGARLVRVPRRDDFSPDLEAIEAAVRREQPRLVFIASPNNPDGSCLEPAALERLLDLPVMVVLDEAYIEFAAPGASRIKEVPQRDNLVVLRTFSKWAGLAGLRVGYGAFPGWLMPALWKVKQPYNVSVAASAAACRSIAGRERLAATCRQIVAERERLIAGLNAIPGLQVFPSQANFVLVRVLNCPAREVKEQLAQAGILVRYFDRPGLDDCLRITAGRPGDTDRLLDCLQVCLQVCLKEEAA